MAKTRSPAYPAIGLKEAVEGVERIWRADYRNPIPRELAAKHMGYTSLNGKSLGALSALIKFGLLEGRGNETRVTELAVQIVAHEMGTRERAEALARAASQPELFAEIEKRFPGGKASDPAVRSYLLTHGFIPSAADLAIRSYRETRLLVDAESEGYGAAPEQEAAQMAQPEQPSTRDAPETSGAQAYRAAATPHADTAAGQRREVITLDEGDVTVSFPEELSAESVADLEEHLKLFIRKAQRRAGADKKTSQPN